MRSPHAAPGWMQQVAAPQWFERYGKRIDSFPVLKGADAWRQWARAVEEDGFALLQAVHALAWVQHLHRDEDGKGCAEREGRDLPPGRLRLSSP